MMKLFKGLYFACVCLVVGNAFGDTARGFRARLTGANEVPPVTDTNAVAGASFRFNSDFSKLRFVLRIKRGVDMTEVHLHCGTPENNGPIVLPLFGVAGPASAPLLNSLQGGLNNTVEVTATVTSASLNPIPCGSDGTDVENTVETLSDLATAMANGQIYVNAHSVANPSGEIRGQVAATNTGTGGTGGTGTGTSSGFGLSPY